eukprot:9992828-Karenia_brevis.AAC.1
MQLEGSSTQSDMSVFTSQNLANSLWAKVCHASSVLFDAIAGTTTKRLKNVDDQLANKVWTFANVGHASPTLDAIAI